MKLSYTNGQHHQADAIWEKRGLSQWITDVFNAPSVKVGRKCTPNIREHVEGEFRAKGWALDFQLVSDAKIKIFSIKDDLAFQLQTGNMSRAPYDLLKLEYLYKSGRIEAAAIGLPTKDAAKIIGDNIANAERVIRELQLFDRVITLPILVVAFE